MANEEHLAILKKGVAAWNEWRTRNPAVEPDLVGADFAGADLAWADFRNADLNGANLRHSDLSEADLSHAVLLDVNLSGAQLGRVHLSRLLPRGADYLSDVCRRTADFHAAQSSGANLQLAELSGANLSGAYLEEAYLAGAQLEYANLCGANLSKACLNHADLSGACLVRTDFTEAELGGAALADADLSGAKLKGANFEGASVGRTTLVNVDLSQTKGLDSVLHAGPSPIGIDTIYLSEGKIPEGFLRGAGVPEEFIAYMKSLMVNPIEFYSCFISYSTKDQEFAERLHADLQKRNVRCWFAPHDVQGGRKLYDQIDQAIRLHEKVLLILSAHSMNSEWVKTEIAKARKREVEQKKQVLFPLRLVSFETIREWECFDADAGKDSAREIREYFIPDFSDWKNHDEYQKAFGLLMRDLKAKEKGRS
jgi:uncharacterized protein YjbI with pentapeptide repeats